MSTVEDHERAFDRPVHIKLGRHATAIGTAYDAGKTLLERWPVGKAGPKHEAARRACWRALKGEIVAKRAREAFEAAAKESDILGEGLLEAQARAAKRGHVR